MDSVTNLVSAFGTLVAIAVSLILLAQGQRDRRISAEDKRRDQASNVTCWATWNENWGGATFGQPRVPSISIRNASNSAVFEVFVDIVNPIDGETWRIDIGAVGSKSATTWDFEKPFTMQDGWVPDALLPRLFFRDSNGLEWKRDGRGRLVVDRGAAADGSVRQIPRNG